MARKKSPLSSPLRVWQSDGRLGGLDNVEYGITLTLFQIRNLLVYNKKYQSISDITNSLNIRATALGLLTKSKIHFNLVTSVLTSW